MDAEVHGLMADERYPRSRDWGLPSFSCKRTKCICNFGGKCNVPSRCEIGEDGKCTGYETRGEDNDRSN